MIDALISPAYTDSLHISLLVLCSLLGVLGSWLTLSWIFTMFKFHFQPPRTPKKHREIKKL